MEEERENNYTIIHRGNGVLIVSMHSTDSDGLPLPDAVFTFRPGEPQYEAWLRRYKNFHPDDLQLEPE